MLHWFKKKAKDFFSLQEKEQIVTAIKNAEHQTSGELRVYIESDCYYPDAMRRAIEVFENLEMYKTENRNGVLIYVAMNTRKLAIYGDEGIYQQLGKEFWDNQTEKLIHYFNKNDYADGIATIVDEVGKVLKQYFPYDNQKDENELLNDIVFGN